MAGNVETGDQADSLKISAVVVAFNEETNIANCLRSAQWCDELVVVDQESTDNTAAIAESLGAAVFRQPNQGYADPSRAFAVSQATGQWILMLDADEMVPASLANKLRSLAASDECDVVEIPYKNYLLGSHIKHTGWGPDQDRHLRFFRKRSLVFSQQIHRYLSAAPDARVLKLPAEDRYCIVHFNYLDSAQWVEKMNRYTSIEADAHFKRGEGGPFTPLRIFKIAARAAFERYVLLGGYRDGFHGFVLSLYIGVYVLLTQVKLWERHDKFDKDCNHERYQALANQILSDYRQQGVATARDM